MTLNARLRIQFYCGQILEHSLYAALIPNFGGIALAYEEIDFTARRYASAVYAVVVCLCGCLTSSVDGPVLDQKRK